MVHRMRVMNGIHEETGAMTSLIHGVMAVLP